MLGFSQFKRAYEEAMEGRALVNEERISKGEFLEKIEGPFRKAFTKENIRKSFEMTGTWPVDRTKITATQLAPARGLSITADPITNLTSPVKVWVNRMNALAQLGDKPAPVLEFPIPSSDHSPSRSLQVMADNDNKNEDEAINIEFCQTRAAFLFDGSGSTSQTEVPPLNLPPLPPFVPPSTSSDHMVSSPADQTTRSQLAQANAALTRDNRKLVTFSNTLVQNIITLQTQVTLLTLENKNQRSKLRVKEKKRMTARERVNSGGRAIEATGDACMHAIRSVHAEKSASSAAKSSRKQGKGRKGSTKDMPAAEIGRRRALFTEAVKVWKTERAQLKEMGMPLKGAGPEPCLYWFIEAKDPENVTPPAQDTATLAPGTSQHHHCATRAVDENGLTDDDINDSSYVDIEQN